MALGNTSSFQSSNDSSSNKYFRPFITILLTFAVWGIMGAMNDVLTNHLKKAFSLTELQSSLVQSAFFAGYFIAAIPAGKLMNKIGYKNGILVGLGLCILGALLFLPAADYRVYGFFLGALLVIAFGCTFLEVAANPYVTVLGSKDSAASRLNLAQGMNGFAKMAAAYFGSILILSDKELSVEQIKAMSAAQFQAFQIEAANSVKGPYMGLVALLIVFAIAIYFSNLPEVAEEADEDVSGKSFFDFPHLVWGVVAIFFYVGAQEAVAGKVINYLEYLKIDNLNKETKALCLTLFLGIFMIGRFIGAFLMRKIDAAKMLVFFALSAAVLSLLCAVLDGYIAVACLIGIGFFNSIQFPTIFAMSLRNLGSYTKQGSTYLVMGICGAAILPAVMGSIADTINIQVAMYAPVICYLVVAYFGIKGHKTK
ncbi:MAG: L-fucose:H+ symporter permease [Cytophagales bacterium]|nr:MAG: L-fucose:H+ symporter permease [Cytophagales bacterium]